jgi:hypothetical protein
MNNPNKHLPLVKKIKELVLSDTVIQMSTEADKINQILDILESNGLLRTK